MLRYIVLFLLFHLNLSAQPAVSSGKVIRLADFQSEFIESRHVDIWLPDHYSEERKYAVLYMHDGQMLFDASSTWNRSSWEVDETAGRLNKQSDLKNFIVVGIHSIASVRHSNYFPQKPFESLPGKSRDSLYALNRAQGNPLFGKPVNSDNYLKFIVRELKPYIDKTYAVKTDREHTYIAGSSMGGLISLYAICEYPEVFGGAACMSTHWPGTFAVENNPIPKAFLRYMSLHLPDPKTHHIWFDYGDQTLDALYAPFQHLADNIMKDKGFTPSNWVSKFYLGKDHSEKAWQERLHEPLQFLLRTNF